MIFCNYYITCTVLHCIEMYSSLIIFKQFPHVNQYIKPPKILFLSWKRKYLQIEINFHHVIKIWTGALHAHHRLDNRLCQYKKTTPVYTPPKKSLIRVYTCQTMGWNTVDTWAVSQRNKNSWKAKQRILGTLSC